MTMKPDSKLVDALHPSPNVGERKKGCRPYLILLHYTGMPGAAKAIHWLAHPKSKVSCHYVIDDTGEGVERAERIHVDSPRTIWVMKMRVRMNRNRSRTRQLRSSEDSVSL